MDIAQLPITLHEIGAMNASFIFGRTRSPTNTSENPPQATASWDVLKIFLVKSYIEDPDVREDTLYGWSSPPREVLPQELEACIMSHWFCINKYPETACGFYKWHSLDLYMLARKIQVVDAYWCRLFWSRTYSNGWRHAQLLTACSE